jgi:ribonuclease P protein component
MASVCACAPAPVAPFSPPAAARAALGCLPDVVGQTSPVLRPENRLRRSADFRHALRRGRRANSRTLVVHAAPGDNGVRVGFAVNRAVGNAVVRNRVRRRLREAVRPQLGALADSGSWDIVIRAHPSAAEATFAELRGDLGECLSPLLPVAA